MSNVPDISNDLKPLEHVIRHKSINFKLLQIQWHRSSKSFHTSCKTCWFVYIWSNKKMPDRTQKLHTGYSQNGQKNWKLR